MCVVEGVVGSEFRPAGWLHPHTVWAARPAHYSSMEGSVMKWTKPEAEVVAVTMEVTAYVATL